MGYSDEMYKDKMLKIEREKLAVEQEKLNVETQKTKVLMDIRDVMLMVNGMIGLEAETRAKADKYDKDDQSRLAEDLADIKKRIEKRWSE